MATIRGLIASGASISARRWERLGSDEIRVWGHNVVAGSRRCRVSLSEICNMYVYDNLDKNLLTFLGFEGCFECQSPALGRSAVVDLVRGHVTWASAYVCLLFASMLPGF